MLWRDTVLKNNDNKQKRETGVFVRLNQSELDAVEVCRAAMGAKSLAECLRESAVLVGIQLIASRAKG